MWRTGIKSLRVARQKKQAKRMFVSSEVVQMNVIKVGIALAFGLIQNKFLNLQIEFLTAATLTSAADREANLNVNDSIFRQRLRHCPFVDPLMTPYY